MMTQRARVILIAIAIVLLGWTIYQRLYEISAIVGSAIFLLILSYYRQGTVLLASKAFHQKNYDKTESLLKQIKNPDRLSKNRRGFYEFMYGNIELNRNNFDEAERHFQLASRFSLRNENDTGLILVQLANLSLRKKDFEKTKAYIEKAKMLKISIRVQNIIERIENEIPR